MEKNIIGIIFFFISVIIVMQIGGNKATYNFLLLVLLGVLISNSDKLKEVKF